MSSDTTSEHMQDVRLRAEIDHSLRHPVMFFLMSGSAWLLVSIILGSISAIKVYAPGFLDHCAFLTYGRVQSAHINALVYGWGFQTAFGVIIWLMARLSRQKCVAPGIILAAGHLWNLGASLGVLAILAGFSTGIPWMEFPAFAWPVVFISYVAILGWSFAQFKARPEGGTYITQWYLLAAMIWFPWVYLTANILLHVFPGNPVMAAGISAWYKSGLIFLFFTPVALGAAFYLVPKVMGRPVRSYPLAKVGFWSLAVLMPWAGMQKMSGVPIPYFIPVIGAFATILFFIPAFTSAVNLLRTAVTSKETITHSPTLRFTVAGIVGLLLMALGVLTLNLPGSTLKFSQFSMTGYGQDVLALYGFFGFVMFGAMYFIVPRLTTCEWLSQRLIKGHFFLSVYGVLCISLAAIVGGIHQGITQERFLQPWVEIATTVDRYVVFMMMGWLFLLIANLIFFLHLVFMWLRFGRRSIHPTLFTSARILDSEEKNHGAASAH